jgi:mono/diheme cytochrome c family protein
MSMSKPFSGYLVLAFVASCLLSSTVLSQTVGLGTPIEQTQLQNFDLIAGPDGEGLPDGSGTALQGKLVFESRCQACHGANGEGTGSSTILVGGNMQTEASPLKTVGSFWPHATTLFDYIRRAMPANAPKSLSNTEVYQVVAYVLYLNGIINQYAVLNKDSLLTIQMPNKDGFLDRSHIQ